MQGEIEVGEAARVSVGSCSWDSRLSLDLDGDEIAVGLGENVRVTLDRVTLFVTPKCARDLLVGLSATLRPEG
jgi:hypothetical protein